MQNKGFSTYQTLNSSIPGHRNIPKRVNDYEIPLYLKPDTTILDIGCNRGYFGIYLSNKIQEYTGIDHDINELTRGNEEIKKQNITNVQLIHGDFETLPLNKSFSFIFSFAVHVYIKLTMHEYATRLSNILKPNGYIFLEGHPKTYEGEPAKLHELYEELKSLGFKTVKEKIVIDRGMEREFTIWNK